MRRAFTLLELIVVIAILLALTAIVLPALAKVRARAIVKRAESDIVKITIAAETYRSLYGHRPLPSWPSPNGAYGSLTSRTVDVPDVLQNAGREYVDPWGQPYFYYPMPINGYAPPDQAMLAHPLLSGGSWANYFRLPADEINRDLYNLWMQSPARGYGILVVSGGPDRQFGTSGTLTARGAIAGALGPDDIANFRQ